METNLTVVHGAYFRPLVLQALVGMLGLLMIAGCDGGVDFSAEMSWPIARSQRPAALASTFGPRIKGSSDDYDFHRGIDIPVAMGTTVLAAASGEVVVAGDDRHFPDDSMLIGHCADAVPPASLDECEEPFFTLYSHLSEMLVGSGDAVARGSMIALSGAPPSDFEHLHFEIRHGVRSQRAAVHPLTHLQHDDTGPAEVTIDEVIFDDPEVPIVHGLVTRPANELDFVRIDVEVYSSDDDRLMSSHSYDVNEWNLEYTPEDDPNDKLDNPFFNGITVRPEPFGPGVETYSVLFRFRELASDVSPEKVRVVVRTFDVDGGIDVAECGPCL